MRQILQAYLFTNDRGIVVFEGVDAAGKGGAIRRLTTVLDPRAYKVWPIGAPNEIERQQHYLTRFWNRLPTSGDDGDLRPLLVRPGAGGTRRGLGQKGASGSVPTARSTSSNTC